MQNAPQFALTEACDQSQDSATSYMPMLRTDPMSRCAALLLPQDTLAITPFFNEQIELEGIDTADMQR